MSIKKVVIPAKYVPAKYVPVEKFFVVSFAVQGGETCDVRFENEVEAMFYASASENGYMQVIHSDYRVCDEEDSDCSVVVWAPGIPRFTTTGMDVRSRTDCFAHSWDCWDDWAEFMPFFPPGAKVARIGDKFGSWRQWDGVNFDDCESPYDSK